MARVEFGGAQEPFTQPNQSGADDLATVYDAFGAHRESADKTETTTATVAEPEVTVAQPAEQAAVTQTTEPASPAPANVAPGFSLEPVAPSAGQPEKVRRPKKWLAIAVGALVLVAGGFGASRAFSGGHSKAPTAISREVPNPGTSANTPSQPARDENASTTDRGAPKNAPVEDTPEPENIRPNFVTGPAVQVGSLDASKQYPAGLEISGQTTEAYQEGQQGLDIHVPRLIEPDITGDPETDIANEDEFLNQVTSNIAALLTLQPGTPEFANVFANFCDEHIPTGTESIKPGSVFAWIYTQNLNFQNGSRHGANYTKDQKYTNQAIIFDRGGKDTYARLTRPDIVGVDLHMQTFDNDKRRIYIRPLALDSVFGADGKSYVDTSVPHSSPAAAVWGDTRAAVPEESAYFTGLDISFDYSDKIDGKQTVKITQIKGDIVNWQGQY